MLTSFFIIIIIIYFVCHLQRSLSRQRGETSASSWPPPSLRPAPLRSSCRQRARKKRMMKRKRSEPSRTGLILPALVYIHILLKHTHAHTFSIHKPVVIVEVASVNVIFPSVLPKELQSNKKGELPFSCLRWFQSFVLPVFARSFMFNSVSPSLVPAVDEYDYTTSERGPTYEYEEKVKWRSCNKAGHTSDPVSL